MLKSALQFFLMFHCAIIKSISTPHIIARKDMTFIKAWVGEIYSGISVKNYQSKIGYEYLTLPKNIYSKTFEIEYPHF